MVSNNLACNSLPTHEQGLETETRRKGGREENRDLDKEEEKDKVKVGYGGGREGRNKRGREGRREEKRDGRKEGRRKEDRRGKENMEEYCRLDGIIRF